MFSLSLPRLRNFEDEDTGWEFGLAMLLMAPQFLYREELGTQGC